MLLLGLGAFICCLCAFGACWCCCMVWAIRCVLRCIVGQALFIVMCYKETRWLGMHKQAGTRTGNHQRLTQQTPAHQRRLTTLNEPQTAIPQPGRCTGIQPTHHTHIIPPDGPPWHQTQTQGHGSHRGRDMDPHSAHNAAALVRWAVKSKTDGK